MSEPLPDDGAAKRLEARLTSPLRVLLLDALVGAPDTALPESTLARETAAMVDDVRGCLNPLTRDGWVERVTLPDEMGWRVCAQRVEALSAAVARAADALKPLLSRLRFAQKDAFCHIIGDGPRMKLIFEQTRIAARTSVPVLLTGETGTGKELIAWAIHRLGARAQAPYVTVNAAAIPATLFESELFGHEKGAFTGASKKRIGKLAAAHRGTFFLDEIGDLPFSGQAKLLRALQEKVVLPVGGTHEVPTDFRLISATNHDLAGMITLGTFRDDLLYRINVLEIRLPALRERLEDVPALARHFLELASWRYGVPRSGGFDAAALTALQGQRWPGNVRELENVVYRAALVAGGATISASHVERALVRRGATPSPADPSNVRAMPLTKRTRRLNTVVREAILEAVARADGNLTAAAKQLDISRVTLYRKLREFDADACGIPTTLAEDA